MRKFRQRRQSFRSARRFVRRTVARMGHIEPKRIILDGVAIPAKTTNPYDNPKHIHLLVAKETTDEEVNTNGTTIAEVHNNGHLVGMKFRFQIPNMGGVKLRWWLWKDEDSELLLTDLTDSFFHTSGDTATLRELRSKCLQKGIAVGTDKTGVTISGFVRRKTLHRLGYLRENDRITLSIATDSASALAITGFGTLYVRTGS